jgi:hypothetical protein
VAVVVQVVVAAVVAESAVVVALAAVVAESAVVAVQ